MKAFLSIILVALCANYAAADLNVTIITTIDIPLPNLTLITQTIVSAANGVVNGVISSVNATLNTITTTLSTLLSTGTSALNQITSVLIPSITTQIGTAISTLQGIITSALNSAVGIVANLLGLLQQVLNFKVQVLLSIVQGLQQVLSTAISLGSSLVTGIQQALGQALQALSSALQQAISQGLTLLGAVGNLGSQVVNAVLASLQSLFGAVQGVLSSIIGTLVSAIVNLVNADIALKISLVNQLINVTGNLLGLIGQELSVIGNGSQALVGQLNATLSGLQAQIQSVIANLQSQLSNATAAVAATLNNLISALQNLTAQIQAQLAQLLGQQNSTTNSTAIQCASYKLNATANPIQNYTNGVTVSPVNITCLPALGATDQVWLGIDTPPATISSALAAYQAQLSSINTAAGLANATALLTQLRAAYATFESTNLAVISLIPAGVVSANAIPALVQIYQNTENANVSANIQFVAALQAALKTATAANSSLVPALTASLQTANTDLADSLRKAINTNLVLQNNTSNLCQDAKDAVANNSVNLYAAYENLLLAQIQQDANAIALGGNITANSNDIINKTNALASLIAEEANALVQSGASQSIKSAVAASFTPLINNLKSAINNVITCGLNPAVSGSTGALQQQLTAIRTTLQQFIQ